jgi:hypothetical protein
LNTLPPDYEFQGGLYRGETAMLDAIAEAWVKAGGMNNADIIREVLSATTDAELTAEVIEGWELAENPPFRDDEPTHMERNRYTAADLEAAFAGYRARHSTESSAEGQ